MFDNNSPNATITIIFNYVMAAPNYNPFYETPFDGEVGKSGNTYVRKNYGIALNTGELILNNLNEKAGVYTNPFIQINYQTANDLITLDKGIVIEYDLNSKTLKFYPSQPTPVLMSITSSGSAVNAEYVMNGFDKATSLSKKWNSKYTTMSTTNCVDFAGQSKYIYYDQALGNGTRKLSWPTASKVGTLGLTSIFYTPKTSTIAEVPTITPADPTKVRFYTSQSVPSITSSTTIILKYFDDGGLSTYDNIQGVFDLVNDQKLCFTQDSSEKMKIWWNQEYLNQILNEIGISSGHSCQ